MPAIQETPEVQEVSRISIKNILFPTDFSPASAGALPFAIAFARIYGATLFLAHAIPQEPHLQVTLDPIPEQDDQSRDEARSQLAVLTRDAMFVGVDVKPLLDRGDLAETITTMIRDHGIDLVVLGSHGRRGVSKLVFGSGAETIFRCAPCPVLTIGPKVHEISHDWKPRRILCPVDVSEDPEPVLHYGLSLAEENQSSILILEAIPMVPWQHRESVKERSRQALGTLIPPDAQDWCTPEVLIRWEHPAHAILEVAKERETDLIVMSVHKSRVAGLSSHLPWPIASEVVSCAGCPVLTIRI